MPNADSNSCVVVALIGGLVPFTRLEMDCYRRG
jgi:hypothetical protein